MSRPSQCVCEFLANQGKSLKCGNNNGMAKTSQNSQIVKIPRRPQDHDLTLPIHSLAEHQVKIANPLKLTVVCIQGMLRCDGLWCSVRDSVF